MADFSKDSPRFPSTLTPAPAEISGGRLDFLPLALAFLRKMGVAKHIDHALGLSPTDAKGPTRAPRSRPTTLVLLRLFAGINVVRVVTAAGPQNYLLGFQPVHREVLLLLGLPPNLYETPLEKYLSPQEPAK